MLQDVLKEWGAHEVTPMEVYTDMFKLGQGYIQRSDEDPGEFKANPIGYYKKKDEEKGHFRIFFEDTFEETLQELQEADFTLVNGLTYFGRKNIQEHASKMFAMIFDLDGITDRTLNAFLSGAIIGNAYPVPNYVALSGHGIHLYYLFEEPISLYPYTKIQLKDLKYALTDKMWNRYTSMEEKVQHQGINQGFRALGAKTKEDAALPVVRVFRLNTHPFSLSQLCEYVPEEHRIDEGKLWRETKYTLAQAKKKFPEWYEKVIVNGDTSRKYWDIAGKVHGDNPYALYDWWKGRILAGASYGHRYFAIMALAIYGAKNDKTYEEVREDAINLVPFLNSINPNEPFTEEDCEVALECYDARYKTFPIKDIEKITGIPIPRNKRNGRKQAVHLGRVRALQQYDDPEGTWRNKDGAPTAKDKVAAYRSEHPDASVSEVSRALNISRTTVYKWWDAQSAPSEPMKDEKKEAEPRQPIAYRFTPDGVEPVYQGEEGAIRPLKMAESMDALRKFKEKKS